MVSRMLLALFAFAPLPALSLDISLSKDECDVWRRELGFAQSVDNHDAAAFAAHIHPDAVFGAASASVVRGRAAVADSWKDIIEGTKIKLVWRPHYVSVGGDPNIAISRGPYYFESKASDGSAHRSIGTFTSVWTRKNAAAPWLVLFDGGGPPPSPVGTREEALAHLATAPAACRS